MKPIYKILVVGLFFFAFIANSYAQSSYKGITITRGGLDPMNSKYGDWTTYCVYAVNYNKYPAKVQFEYKLNSREAPWQKSEVHLMQPTKSVSIYDYQQKQTDRAIGDADYKRLECYNGEIKALRIIYVDIDYSERNKKILKGTGEFIDGMVQGMSN